MSCNCGKKSEPPMSEVLPQNNLRVQGATPQEALYKLLLEHPEVPLEVVLAEVVSLIQRVPANREEALDFLRQSLGGNDG